MYRVVSVILIALCLASCASAPAESDIRSAVDRLLRQETDNYNSRIKDENAKAPRPRYAERPYPIIATLKKIDCVPASDAKPKPGFICYFEMTLDGTPLKRPGRFYVDEGNWVYARL